MTKLEQLRQKKAEGDLTQKEYARLKKREYNSELSKKKVAEKNERLSKIQNSPINGRLFSKLRNKA